MYLMLVLVAWLSQPLVKVVTGHCLGNFRTDAFASKLTKIILRMEKHFGPTLSTETFFYQNQPFQMSIKHKKC